MEKTNRLIKVKKVPEHRFICSCGCRAELIVQVVAQDQLMVDTRTDGRHRWVGVVLSKKDSKKFIQSLDNSFSPKKQKW